jgi:hypothetical protein
MVFLYAKKGGTSLPMSVTIPILRQDTLMKSFGSRSVIIKTLTENNSQDTVHKPLVFYFYLEQKIPCHIVERVVAELARVSVILAVLASVEVLAGEALVEVEAFLFLHAAVEEVELAELPDLRGVRVVRVEALLLRLQQDNTRFR